MGLQLAEYKIDAIPTWISPTDFSWDFETINAERAKLGPGERHPLDDYFEGLTRFALDAVIRVPKSIGRTAPTVTVREYLKGVPVAFELKRLGARERARVTMMLSTEQGLLEGVAMAAHFGCCGITGGESDGIKWEADLDGGLAWSVLDKLAPVQGLVQGLGQAVQMLNKRISPSEGKP